MIRLSMFGLITAMVASVALNDPAMAMGKKRKKPGTPPPVTEPTQPSQPAQPTQPQPVPQPDEPISENAFEVAQRVRYLMISDFKVVDQADYSPEFLTELSSAILSCGLTFTGPLCLDDSFANSRFNTSLAHIETSDTFIFFSLISMGDNSASLALIVEAEKDSSRAVARTIGLYAISNKVVRAEVAKSEFLLGRLKKVAELSAPADSLEFAASELSKTPDFRKLYHFSQFILNVDKKQAQRAAVLAALRSRHHAITGGGSAVYQSALLEMLRASFASERELLVSVSDALLPSQNEAVSQLAAITLAEREVKNEAVVAKVRDALANQNWALRRLAIYALEKIKSGVADENLIITMLKDADSDVREAARRVVSTYRLGLDHLAVLSVLASHADWSVRRMAINFVGSISGAGATAVLALRLSDADSDVAGAAYQQLDRRPLAATDFAVLSPHLSSANWSHRIKALKLVAKLGSAEAMQALVKMLADSDGDVRNATVAALAQYRLTSQELPLLARVLGNANWSIRVLAVRFIGTVPGNEATSLLLGALNDADGDVRAAVQAELKKRGLAQTELEALDKLAQSASVDARLLAAKYLEAILGPQSDAILIRLTGDADWRVRHQAVRSLAARTSSEVTVALIGKLLDPDADVRAAAVAIVNQRTLTNQELPALRSQLENGDWQVRRRAVGYVSRINTLEATDALIGMLADRDSDVRVATSNALSSRAMTNRELAALTAVAATAGAEALRGVILFIGRVNTVESTQALVALLANQSWQVRLDVVKLLGAIRTDASTAALITRLTDSDADVRGAATQNLNTRVFNDLHVGQLDQLLNNPGDWKARQLAAAFLGTTSSCRALTMLINRLIAETDADVVNQVKKSIQAIKGRNGSC